jgi:hypothetical protein
MVLSTTNISHRGVTAAGIEGLDEIRTLQCLKAGGRVLLDASTLRRCRSLREVDLCSSKVTDAILAALADVSTLETLSLSRCPELRDVSALARSVSLRELELSASAVRTRALRGWSASHPHSVEAGFV